MISKLLKSTTFKVIATIIIIGFVGTLIFRLITPDSVSIDQLVTTGTKLNTNFEFSINAIEYPNSLAVYKTDQANFSASSLASRIATNLEIPKSRFKDVWQDDNLDDTFYKRVLRVTPENTLDLKESRDDSISYDIEVLGRTANPEAAQVAAQVFVNNAGVYPNEFFKLSQPKEKLINELGMTDPKNGQFNLFEFILKQEIDGIPVVSQDFDQPPAIIHIYRDGSFFRATFYPQTTNFEQTGTLSTVDWLNLQTNIQSGLFTVIKVNSIQLTAPQATLENLTRVDLSGAQIQYRINAATGSVLPYMQFSGFGTDAEGFTYEVIIITPLVKVQ